MGTLRATVGILRVDPVDFFVDGRRVSGHPGESVAAALLDAGVAFLRTAPRDGAPRGMFCAMGVCQECVVEIDGRRVESCRATVREGLQVKLLGGQAER